MPPSIQMRHRIRWQLPSCLGKQRAIAVSGASRTSPIRSAGTHQCAQLQLVHFSHSLASPSESASPSAFVNIYLRTIPTTVTNFSESKVVQSRSSPGNTRRLHTSAKMASATTFYDFKPLDGDGKESDLNEHKGKVVLIVNTASKCGFTPQYDGLQALYKEINADEKYKDKFVILGFPCNQFGHQEPGSHEEIQDFCTLNHKVEFPIMTKVNVNEPDAAPIFEWLKSEKPGLFGIKKVKWNFEKFLVGKDGKVKNRWSSITTPASLRSYIIEELDKA
ncbi:thioredoxin-like protein [Truncatella angustata]|uniref:Glutathione peroxidase n=1 Tax=Truncatella angustata TaxID=152316 RepID=A0A9P8UH33_9PEZI|nr:thioredoxin-like protein [Truncatella angustata]KAH6652237.1 thioredoxin-like protein [Truncatella angustata]